MRDEGIPSLVYPNATGAIVGFMGVVPRPTMFQDQPIRVAVGTQLMVDPAAAAGKVLRRLDGEWWMSF